MTYPFWSVCTGYFIGLVIPGVVAVLPWRDESESGAMFALSLMGCMTVGIVIMELAKH